MGVMCAKSTVDPNSEFVFQSDEYKDVKFKKYSSNIDYYYNAFDNKFNLLKHIGINEFSILLKKFQFDLNKPESHMETKKAVFDEVVNKTDFITFIDNKILNNFLIYDLRSDATKIQLFSEYFQNMFETIRKGYVSYTKLKKFASGHDRRPKKYFLLALAILYCGGDNLAKLELLFTLFANEVNKIENSAHFQSFIYLLFLIATYGGMKNIDDLSVTHSNFFKTLDNEEKAKIYSFFEISIIIEKSEKFTEEFFGIGGCLTYNEYLQKVVNEGYDWIFCSSGIRSKFI